MVKSICCVLLILSLQTAFAQSWYTTGQNADLMVSGVNFNQTGGLYFNHPNGIATDGAHFLVCDRFNNRILVWNSLPAAWDAQPDFVLGQPDFTSNDPGTGKNQLNWVGNASIGANGKLAVADTENDRILLWNSFPGANAQPADVSIFLPAISDPNTGQFYAWPWGVWTDGTRLAAVATQGGALLFWDNFPDSDDAKPDYVIKLPQFGTPRNISTDGSSYFFVGDHNAKVNGTPGTFFWNAYPTAPNQPYDFYRDEWIKGEKLPDGKLVAGGLLSFYVWNTMPTDANQNPDLVLQPSMYKNGDGVDVTFAGDRLYVNNYNGNDVLVYNSLPVNAGQLPDFALGSPGINAQTLDSLYYVQNPVPVTDGTRLIVTSDFDRAIYIWDQFPDHSGQAYDHRIQTPPNVHIWASTLHHNIFATGARNVLSVWNDASQLSATPSYQLVNQIGTAQLDDIRGLALDDKFFYLATKSGKLYVWEGIPTTNSQNPILTLSSSAGQFGFLYSDGEYLCAARPEPPTGVDIYRISDLAAGNTVPYIIVNSGQVHINQASQGATFNGSLAITSRGDHRVILWEKPSEWGLPDKAIVLGQPDVQHFDAAIGERGLFMPTTLLPREEELWVGEFKFSSRILKYSHGTTAAPDIETSVLEAQLFPNPAEDYFTLQFEAPESGLYQVELLDASGRLLERLFAGNLNQGETFLKTFSSEQMSLARGVYFVRVNGPSSRRILKMLR